MEEAVDVKQRLEHGLRPYTKPREQVNYIRRVLALHLATENQSIPLKEPLSLAGTSQEADPTGGKGIYKDYLEASQTHAATKTEFQTRLKEDIKTGLQPKSGSTSNAEFLEKHNDLLELRQKCKRLLQIQEHLETLSQMPACSQGFTDPSEVFQRSKDLPTVPNVVVGSLVIDQTSSLSDLKSKVQHLERTALRAKLLLKQQERLLQETKARAKRHGNTVTGNAERLRALHATRAELINWMETELSNASSEDNETHQASPNTSLDSEGDRSVIETKLAAIQVKYKKYLDLRRAITAAAAHRPQPSIPPPALEDTGMIRLKSRDISVDYLLTPYVENLLFLAKSLKANIGQKAHMNSVLAQCIKDSRQTLQHLAEESQLLSANPTKSLRGTKEGTSDESVLGSNTSLGLSSQIRPWVLAADSAKIDTLESVTETVETGQFALEKFMEQLEAVDRLLGREKLDSEEEVEGSVEDLWLGTTGQPKAPARTNVKAKKGEPNVDVWSRLHGDLGLLRQEEH